MSKVSEAKIAQGYMKEKDRPNCGNCSHFTCDETKSQWGGGVTQSNLRCSFGAFFAVQKKSICEVHKRID
jgi:hypothetical protein